MTDSISIRVASSDDIDGLIPLMRGYYRDDELPFDQAVARRVMLRLLSEPQWGRVLLAKAGDRAIGYAATM
jgi:hypothetical protein